MDEETAIGECVGLAGIITGRREDIEIGNLDRSAVKATCSGFSAVSASTSAGATLGAGASVFGVQADSRAAVETASIKCVSRMIFPLA